MIDRIDLHVFADASKEGTRAVLYAVLYQPSEIQQRLEAAKPRVAKRGLIIPRLELIACHIAANLP